MLRYRTGDVTRFVEGACPCGRTHRRIARFSGRVDDMLVVRGVNVFPSEIEAAILDDPALAGHYAIVLDRRSALVELEVRAELCSPEAASGEAEERLRGRLSEALRVRTRVAVGAPGSIPRQEAGKAQRVFERTAEHDPFPD